MNDPNRLMKWLLTMGLIVVSLVILYPPREKLKGGIDLVGGTSLLFEIDTADLSPADKSGLSSRVMGVLKDRVDPKGQMNLEWRPVGNTRLEIRMPRPPREAIERREAYNAAIDRLAAISNSRFDVEAAFNSPENERTVAIEALKRGVTERGPRLEELKTAHAAYQAVQGTGESAVVAPALAAYEAAMSKVLATSLPVARLTDVLALPPGTKRDAELDKLRKEFPSYDAAGDSAAESKPITRVVQAYDHWSANKADLEDPSDLKRRIKGAGVLEFRILADRNPGSPDNTGEPVQSIKKYTDQLTQSGARPKAGDHYRWFPVENLMRFAHVENVEEFEKVKDLPGRPIMAEYAGRYYVLAHNDPEHGLLQGSARKWSLRQANPDRNPLTGENVVAFTLDPRGGQMFGELTGNNINRQLCIMLDNAAVSSANIEERITERCQIRGNFTLERVQDLVRTLDAGSLPARLKETPLSEQTIGPSLGESNRTKGMQAAVWGGLLVAAFMLFYYGLAGGGCANIALGLNLLITLALMALMQATFTLPGIAGLILTVGMAVDANVLIFERIREESARGVIFKKALNAGYDRAFSAIFDGNLTTLITCVILWFAGSEEIKGFGITLGLGLATSMFTALTVTRLIFNTLIAQGWLTHLSMRRSIGIPAVDWVGMRRIFWPVSVVVVVGGFGLFLGRSVLNTESLYDIEFLGGTSVQIDLRTGVTLSDDEVRAAITDTEGTAKTSAVQWLNQAAEKLAAANVAVGETPGQLSVTSDTLSGEQLADLLRRGVEDKVERGGIRASGHTVTLTSKGGLLDQPALQTARTLCVAAAKEAANRLRGARVQSVGVTDRTTRTAQSYEIVTIETNRALVQAAVLATLGDRLNVQQAIGFSPVRDNELTKEPFFVIESDDHFLSDVIGGEANFDVRRYRGGATVEVTLDATASPLSVEEFQRRLREVALHPEFEQFRSRESAVFPLGASAKDGDGRPAYKHFAVCASDESLVYDESPAQWTEGLGRTTLTQVEAALGSEKSLTKVIQFAPQVAGQTKNKALFAAILSLLAIGAYVWLRFGNKEFGLAVIVTLVHDVGVTLGMVALSHAVYDSFLGKALLLEDFRIDLPMMAAILTLIGYSLNDTIVVFDRIRENRGRAGTMTGALINASINQTMSRTVLTSLTVFIVVVVLYVFGGSGVHGFSFALIVGVISGTYSTVGIAVPLVYRPQVLRNVCVVLTTLLLIGVIFAQVPVGTARWVLIGVAAIGGLVSLVRGNARNRVPSALAQPVGA